MYLDVDDTTDYPSDASIIDATLMLLVVITQVVRCTQKRVVKGRGNPMGQKGSKPGRRGTVV